MRHGTTAGRSASLRLDVATSYSLRSATQSLLLKVSLSHLPLPPHRTPTAAFGRKAADLRLRLVGPWISPCRDKRGPR